MLGPLLFVIFINNLPKCIKSTIPFIFADDTKCLIEARSTTDTDKLKEDINSATDWSYFTNFLFNVAKFFHIQFLLKPPLNPGTSVYTVNGKPPYNARTWESLSLLISTGQNTTK